MQAIARMLRALDETVIGGVPTTGPFHKLILNNDDFRAGIVDTGFIPKHADDLQTPPATSKVGAGVQLGWLPFWCLPSMLCQFHDSC